jgi:integrase
LWAAYRREGKHVARFILTALYTGSRSGVVCGAGFKPDATHGYIDLERGVFYRAAAGHKETKKRRPPVPISTRLKGHLLRWKREGGKTLVEWRGEPVAKVRKAFARSVQAAGLGPDVTPHTLRHTAATWLMQEGVDPWKAAGMLGMTTDTLIEHYGHWHPAIGRGAAEALSQGGRNLPQAPTR